MSWTHSAWTTAGGDTFAICDMEDGHLFNAIRSTERWADREMFRTERPSSTILKEHGSYRALVHEAIRRAETYDTVWQLEPRVAAQFTAIREQCGDQLTESEYQTAHALLIVTLAGLCSGLFALSGYLR